MDRWSKLRSSAFAPQDETALQPSAAAGAAGPRVFLAGKLTALESPGGGEIQMLCLARALVQAGVDARLWRPWEDRLASADCLHLFGSLAEHLPLIEAAHRQRVRVVLSPIAWFDVPSYWRAGRGLVRRGLGCAGLVVRRCWPRMPSWRRTLYHAADLLLPNSTAEAQQLMDYYGVPAAHLHVVPNGADERFAEADPEPFVRRFQLRDFVLCPGRIEARKNQLQLIRALRGTGIPLVLVGDVVPGHEAYLARCRREAGPQVYFLSRLDHDDPLLASAYAACACLALVSWYETPGLVALEAGMSGVPLVLPRAGCAPEYFGEHAVYVPPDALWHIRTAVMAALACGRSAALAQHVRTHFTWRAAAWATREAYHKVLAR